MKDVCIRILITNLKLTAMTQLDVPAMMASLEDKLVEQLSLDKNPTSAPTMPVSKHYMYSLLPYNSKSLLVKIFITLHTHTHIQYTLNLPISNPFSYH